MRMRSSGAQCNRHMAPSKNRDGAAPVKTSVKCAACGYSMEGLPDSARCPECDSVERRSSTDHDLSHRATHLLHRCVVLQLVLAPVSALLLLLAPIVGPLAMLLSLIAVVGDADDAAAMINRTHPDWDTGIRWIFRAGSVVVAAVLFITIAVAVWIAAERVLPGPF